MYEWWLEMEGGRNGELFLYERGNDRGRNVCERTHNYLGTHNDVVMCMH